LPRQIFREPMVNAVRVRGFWRGESNSVVLEQFNKLVEAPTIFGKEISVKANSKVELVTLVNNQMVIRNEASPERKDDLGAAFELIIPINNPFTIK